MHTSKGPTDPTKAAKLQLKIGFRCRQAIRELMFAAVTCRPDFLFPKTLLSQCNTPDARDNRKHVIILHSQVITQVLNQHITQ